MAEKSSMSFGVIAKLVAAIAAIVVGLFLVFGSMTPVIADAVFVGAIALVLAIYLWPGVTPGQARIVAFVLIFVAAYAFIRGFGLLDLNLLREIGGILAIVAGVVLILPFVRSRMGKGSTAS